MGRIDARFRSRHRAVLSEVDFPNRDMVMRAQVFAPTSRAGGSQHALNTGLIPDQGSPGVELSPTIVPDPTGLEAFNSPGDKLWTDIRSFTRQENQLAEVRLPPPESIFYRTDEETKTVPIQLWEGKVLDVRRDSGTMDVYLLAKIGNFPDHTGEIGLEWVHSQDVDLVRPGAIFYLSLYKETKRGSISNSQELRFRRLPSWSRSQIERVKLEAARLLDRIQEKPQVG